MFNKVQLIERGKHYFNGNDRKVIYATSDGNFFNEQHFAASHAKSNKQEVFTIIRGDMVGYKEPIKEDPKPLAENTEDNQYDEYKEATGKNAIWNDKETKAYTKWLNDN